MFVERILPVARERLALSRSWVLLVNRARRSQPACLYFNDLGTLVAEPNRLGNRLFLANVTMQCFPVLFCWPPVHFLNKFSPKTAWVHENEDIRRKGGWVGQPTSIMVPILTVAVPVAMAVPAVVVRAAAWPLNLFGSPRRSPYGSRPRTLQHGCPRIRLAGRHRTLRHGRLRIPPHGQLHIPLFGRLHGLHRRPQLPPGALVR